MHWINTTNEFKKKYVSKYQVLGSFLIILFFTNCTDRNISTINNDNTIPAIDNALLDTVQHQTFNYYWQGIEPISGAARERIHMDGVYEYRDSHYVTSGGTGFGVMAVLVGIQRGFITREQGLQRLDHLTKWLEQADRFHGAWPHWWYPEGRVRPFSTFDDGGDLVETSFLIQGLIAARQYFLNGNEREKILVDRINKLWHEVDWDFYTQGKNVLYWHWSPNHAWKMNFAVRGYNECLIMYVLAASSPTHPIDTNVYHQGFMRGGKIVTDKTLYDLPTVLDHYETEDIPVGPLFWAHYSYLGLDPRKLKDRYADWWTLNQNHALIHHRHAVKNPNHYKGYSDSCWGMTSSYSQLGYSGHNPNEDNGEISPTAALSSFPYTPYESMKFLKYLYQNEKEYIGAYGPYDVFSKEKNWYTPRYLAIDQLTIPVMIENYRSGMIWDLFMSAPEVKNGLKRLGFRH